MDATAAAIPIKPVILAVFSADTIAAPFPENICIQVYAADTVDMTSSKPALLTVPSKVMGLLVPLRDSVIAELTLPNVNAGLVVVELKTAATVKAPLLKPGCQLLWGLRRQHGLQNRNVAAVSHKGCWSE